MNRFALPNTPVKEAQLAMVTGSIYHQELLGKIVAVVKKVDMSHAIRFGSIALEDWYSVVSLEEDVTIHLGRHLMPLPPLSEEEMVDFATPILDETMDRLSKLRELLKTKRENKNAAKRNKPGG